MPVSPLESLLAQLSVALLLSSFEFGLPEEESDALCYGSTTSISTSTQPAYGHGHGHGHGHDYDYDYNDEIKARQINAVDQIARGTVPVTPVRQQMREQARTGKSRFVLSPGHELYDADVSDYNDLDVPVRKSRNVGWARKRRLTA